MVKSNNSCLISSMRSFSNLSSSSKLHRYSRRIAVIAASCIDSLLDVVKLTQLVFYFLLDDAEHVQKVAAMQCDTLCISCTNCDY